MFTDIEIAQSCAMQPIAKIADTLGVAPDLLEPYGKYKAKVDYLALKDLPQKGKLVLVTAINPTPAGEGKTTVSIGLADALRLACTCVHASPFPIYKKRASARFYYFSVIIFLRSATAPLTSGFVSISLVTLSQELMIVE